MLKDHEAIFEMFLDLFRYEPETGDIYHTYRLSGETKKVGLLRAREGYLCIRFIYKDTQYEVSAHRLAWRLTYGEWPKGELIHKNGVKRDNRIENLLLAKGNHKKTRRKQNV